MTDREHPKFSYVAPADLKPWGENPRVIDQAEFDALCRSLQNDPEHMEARPLVALPDGTVIAGNMRLRAVQHLGWRHVPVVYRDLDRDQAKQVALMDNNSFGRWHEDELAEMLHELAGHGVDLDSLGFSPAETKKLLDTARGGGDGGAGEDVQVKEQFGVIVVTTTEADQEQVYRDLQQTYGPLEGHAVRVVVV